MSAQSTTVSLARSYHFSASHRLHAPSFTNEQNANTFGKCNNPHGHGHNYIVTITLSAQVDPARGMVADLAALDRFAQQHLLDVYHLANLNTLPAFANLVPTTENLAVELFRLFARFPGARITAIRIDETGNNSFRYLGPHIRLKPQPLSI